MIITPAQTCGPLFGFALTPTEVISSAHQDDPDAVIIEGTIFDGEGQTLGYGAFVEIWSAEQSVRVRTLDGTYRTVMRRPQAVELGHAEQLVPHLDIRIFMRGLSQPLLTKMYFPGTQEVNDQDPVLRQLPTQHRDQMTAQSTGDGKHYRFDIHLQSPHSTFFTTDN